MIIVANFKANKNNKEVISWIEKFNQLQNSFSGNLQVEIVVCPSSVSLSDAFRKIKSLPRFNRGKPWKIKISLGAQDVSAFEEGAYTAESTVKMIKDYVEFVLVGHSERRKYFSESNESVIKKVMLLKKANLTPIVCVSKIEEVKVFDDFAGILLAYEPLFAIGSGKAETLKNVDYFVKEARSVLKDVKVLYGGSVTPENIREFTKDNKLYGVLVGSSSLDPYTFANIVSHAW